MYIETHCFALEDSLVIFVLHPTHTSVFMHLSLHSERWTVPSLFAVVSETAATLTITAASHLHKLSTRSIRDKGLTHLTFCSLWLGVCHVTRGGGGGWGGLVGAVKCKQCLAHHTPGAIFMIFRQIRIESMVKKVMSWTKKRKKSCDVLVFLSACSYLMKHYK